MKNPNHKREQRFPFAQRFLAGLIIALALSLNAFEWTTARTTSCIPELYIETTYVYNAEIFPLLNYKKKKFRN